MQKNVVLGLVLLVVFIILAAGAAWYYFMQQIPLPTDTQNQAVAPAQNSDSTLGGSIYTQVQAQAAASSSEPIPQSVNPFDTGSQSDYQNPFVTGS